MISTQEPTVNRKGSFTEVPESLRMPASGPEATCPNDDVTKYPFDRLRTHCSETREPDETPAPLPSFRSM